MRTESLRGIICDIGRLGRYLWISKERVRAFRNFGSGLEMMKVWSCGGGIFSECISSDSDDEVATICIFFGGGAVGNLCLGRFAFTDAAYDGGLVMTGGRE